MGLFGGKHKVSVTCFGKLQIFSDFIEPVHYSGFGNELREWLTVAIGSEGPKLSSTAASGMTYRLAWPLRGGKDVLTAVLWSSRDAVGRWFPFCLMTQVPQKKLRLQAMQEFPLALSPLWIDLQELAIYPRNGTSWRDLQPGEASEVEIQKAVMDARFELQDKDPIVGKFEDSLRSLGALEFLEKLFSASFWVFYPRAAWMLIDIAHALSNDPNLAVALRLPASEELSAAYQAAFWLRSLERLTRGQMRRKPTIFLPVRSAAEKGIWLLFREPLAMDLESLFGGGSGHDYLLDLRRLEYPDAEPSGLDAFVDMLQKRLTREMSALELADIDLAEIRRAANPSAGGMTW